MAIGPVYKKLSLGPEVSSFRPKQISPSKRTAPALVLAPRPNLSKEVIWGLPFRTKIIDWAGIVRDGLALDHCSQGSDGRSKAEATEVCIYSNRGEKPLFLRLAELCEWDPKESAQNRISGIVVTGDATDVMYYPRTNLLIADGTPEVVEFTGQKLFDIGALPVQKNNLSPLVFGSLVLGPGFQNAQRPTQGGVPVEQYTLAAV